MPSWGLLALFAFSDFSDLSPAGAGASRLLMDGWIRPATGSVKRLPSGA